MRRRARLTAYKAICSGRTRRPTFRRTLQAGTRSKRQQGVSVSVPNDPSLKVRSRDATAKISVGLPFRALGIEGGVVARRHGHVYWQEAALHNANRPQRQGQSSLRVIVAPPPSAMRTRCRSLKGRKIERQVQVSILVVKGKKMVASILAMEAEGPSRASVPTHYEVKATSSRRWSITAANAAYPIVADPFPWSESI